MVPQDKPVKIKVGKEFLVERNLPGQRMGAKSWYILVLRKLHGEGIAVSVLL